MRRRDDGHAGIGRTPDTFGHDQPLIIDRQRDQFGLGCRQHTANAGITRILDPDLFTGIKQGACRQINGLLGPCGDDDLFGHAIQTPDRTQIIGNRDPQRHMTARVAVRYKGAWWITPEFGDHPAPLGPWEPVDFG